jgi:hypothetical protein
MCSCNSYYNEEPIMTVRLSMARVVATVELIWNRKQKEGSHRQLGSQTTTSSRASGILAKV